MDARRTTGHDIFRVEKNIAGEKVKKLMTIITSLPYDNFLYKIKFKAFADDNSYVTKTMMSVFDKVENIVGKGENAFTAFSLLPTMFSKGLFSRVIKCRDCVVKC